MSSQTSVPAPLPWYDDRVKTLHSESASSWGHTDNNIPTPWDDAPAPDAYDTPRKIYDFLNTRVWRQDAAKQAAAMVMYLCLRGLKSNAIFVGPTGCGKTYIWRCLREIFPGRIEIADGSNVTLDGWKGDKKWQDLLRFPAALSGEPAVLVVDEADKMLAPKFSNYENVSHSVQSEGLTMLEGSRVTIKDGPVVHEVDTSKISFVLCGAFSSMAHDIAAQASQRHIGFGVTQNTATQPYDQPLDEQDLIDYGVMPEFLGRIQRIVNLQPMLMDDYYRMMEAPHGVLWQLQRQYGMEIRITPQRRRELAAHAYATGLGVRGMEGQIRKLIDDAIFADCERQSLEL